MQPLSAKAVTVWRIRIACLTVAGAFLCGVLAAFSLKLAAGLGAGLLTGALASAFWYCPRRSRASRWEVSRRGAFFTGGVFFGFSRSLPLERVQYAELLRTPAQRWCGTCTLLFHAAGAKLALPQLDWEQGYRLYLRINGGGIE